MIRSATIHFHGGIGTIGGTKIIVQEAGYRVLFDFGLAYAPGGDFWGHRIAPRPGHDRLKDLMALGYVPRLDGLYRATDCKGLGLEPGCGDGSTHVFISHVHLDHMAVVDLLADDLPVWMHGDTLRLFQAVAATGEEPPVPKAACSFQWGEEIRVGPLSVVPLAVDHDIPGASGLLIHTSAGTVVYTGDLRAHGAQPELTEAFLRAARDANPRILLIEGTRLGEPEAVPDAAPRLCEPEVPGRVAECCAGSPGLALISLYPRNILRVAEIAAAVRRLAGRTLALSPETAFIFRAMGGNLGDVALYRRSADLAAPPPWLDELIASGIRVVDAAAVRAHPAAYLLQLNYWDAAELIDLEPPEGSVFIHSNGEPLGRFDPAYDLFARWVGHFKLEWRSAACTGHAAPADLAWMVRSIEPRVLMPIHSRAPELLEVDGVRRVLPELGASYDVATGERIG